METKKFKLAGTGNAKGGHNNTRTTLTTAGVSAAAGIAAGFVLRGGHRNPQQEVHDEPETTQEVAQAVQEHQQEVTSQQQQVIDENITEPQPVDNNITNNSTPTGGSNEADVVPEDVAQQIVQSFEIDENDVDADNVFNVTGFTTVNGPDGEEQLVAVIKAQDGSEFVLADLDGDGVYSDVFDMAGNYAGEAEGNLTAGDLIVMTDDTGNYIAAVEDPGGDDPTHGIVDTQPATMLASNEENEGPEPQTTSEPSEDEILAELTENLNEEESSLLDRIVEWTEGEEGESGGDENGEEDPVAEIEDPELAYGVTDETNIDE